jgi:hypothetical protein
MSSSWPTVVKLLDTDPFIQAILDRSGTLCGFEALRGKNVVPNK